MLAGAGCIPLIYQKQLCHNVYRTAVFSLSAQFYAAVAQYILRDNKLTSEGSAAPRRGGDDRVLN